MTTVKFNRQLDCKDLHGYLRKLQHSVLDRLYNHPATCLAVFRFVLAPDYVNVQNGVGDNARFLCAVPIQLPDSKWAPRLKVGSFIMVVF